MFIDKLVETSNENSISVTENGAIGFSTSGKHLLDLNFKVASLRNKDEDYITDLYAKAFYEDKLLAMKWLFAARDREEGFGERRLFRICLKWLAENHPCFASILFRFAPVYGRYDDVLCLLDTSVRDMVIFLIKEQLKEDMAAMGMNKQISLLAKWLPSANASSKETKRYAKMIYTGLNISEKKYRKMLSALRKYLDVIEVKISKNEWDKIDYNTVPSRANLKYQNAFCRHDEVRRLEYLDSLNKGVEGVKINGSVNFPHDIVSQYGRECYRENTTLEALWKALPDFVKGQGNTICVADGSGSMLDTVGNSSVKALDVANALAIYFAEHSSGEFKDKYITFSENPQLVDFSKAKSLSEKLKIARLHNEVADTNIEAVFDLLLDTAVRNKMDEKDIPANVLILSDMEFNTCVIDNNSEWEARKTLFREIEKKWNDAGYKMPRCVFWNLNSRTGTIPVNIHENFPVALVSGFSPAICKMVLNGELDPMNCLINFLNSRRYQVIEDSIRHLL